jgi:hypothetical protein
MTRLTVNPGPPLSSFKIAARQTGETKHAPHDGSRSPKRRTGTSGFLLSLQQHSFCRFKLEQKTLKNCSLEFKTPLVTSATPDKHAPKPSEVKETKKTFRKCRSQGGSV